MKTPPPFKKILLYAFSGTAALLSIPFIGMRFTNEVNWTVTDFVLMGMLLMGAGMAYAVLVRFASSWLYRLAVATAVGTALLLVWANLAVGLIGSGPHAGNLMYMGVIAVLLVGSYLSRITAKGMARTLLAAAVALVVLAAIALLTGMQHYPGSSVEEILAVNGFFALLFTGAAFLFQAAHVHDRQTA